MEPYNNYMNNYTGYTSNSYYNPNPNPYYNYNNYNANNKFKFVENIDAAKAADVPIGGYDIFPKTDLSEIYVKTWNSDGTTNTLTYQLADGQEINAPITLEQLNNKLNTLTEKIDSLLTKKGISSNDY